MHGIRLDDGCKGIYNLLRIGSVRLIAAADDIRNCVVVYAYRQHGARLIFFNIGFVRIPGSQKRGKDAGDNDQPVGAAQKPQGIGDKAGKIELFCLRAFFILHGLPPDRIRTAFRTFRTFRISRTFRTSHRRRIRNRNRIPPAAAATCGHR